MMKEEDNIRKVIRKFMEAVLLYGDSQTAIETISENIIGIGMGNQGTITNRQELQAKLEIINTSAVVPCQINYPKEEIHYHPPSFATASITYEIVTKTAGKLSKSSFIQTIAAKKEDDQWKICLVQAIPVELTQNSIENYPIAFAEGFLATMRAQVSMETFDIMSNNLVGGVVGVYVGDGKYPLYFANEGISSLLGYTSMEFHEVFKDNVALIFYSEDFKYIMELTDNMILQGRDISEKIRLQKKDGSLLTVLNYARKTNDNNGNDILIAVFTDISELVALQEKLEQQNATTMSGIHYASKIQRDLLPLDKCFAKAFSDYSIIWKPRDIVGGDIYWLKTFKKGSLLAVCDCTGHGTSGALLTMLMASTFDICINENNCQDTAQLLMEADKKISDILNVNTMKHEESDDNITNIHDGCDLALLFISNDGSVRLSSAGITVFICNGNEVNQIKGQRLHIGNGDINDKSKVAITEITSNPCNKFYIASDGLFDQIGGELSHPFGYRVFKDIILKNHMKKQAVISEEIWNAFEKHRGQHYLRDDVELITFKP